MDKIPELLSKLLENYPLATLFLGVFLVAFSGIEKLPLGSTTVNISSQVKLVLLIIGLILTIVSILSLFKEQLPNSLKMTDGRDDYTIQEELEKQKAVVTELEELVREIKAFVESRNDETSLAVLDILNGVKDQAREYAKAARESRLAAKWLRSKQQSLLLSIKHSDFNSKHLEEFRSEIQKYLELVIESLEKSKYIAPRARKISFHIGNPFPYVKALQVLKKQIEREFSNNQDELKETELARLNDCIDNLAEVIRRESSH
ncbi:MAG: hypothetical protein HC899_09745 [Leptolyngbyaceae cyanobacterium SM1_4_3]|nr:hypothetical protein [Leptolyngbyaceae cyanobacterium SM1_4_3]